MDAYMEVCGRDPDSRFVERAADVFAMKGTRVFYRLEDDHAVHLVTEPILQAEHTLGRTPLHHHSGSRTTP